MLLGGERAKFTAAGIMNIYIGNNDSVNFSQFLKHLCKLNPAFLFMGRIFKAQPI